MSKARIYYYDIGDYLSREEKLDIVQKFGSVENMENQWQILQPNEHGDWLNQRDDAFGAFIPLGDKDNKANANIVFVPFYSNGVKTNRDAWVYNFGKQKVVDNMKSTIKFYNEEVKAFLEKKKSSPNLQLENGVSFDTTKITWTREIKWDAEKGKIHEFDTRCIVKSIYRPFTKQFLYFSPDWNNTVYLIPKLFPTPDTENRVICVSGVGVTKEFTCLMTDIIPDLEVVGKSQCFPLYYYEERAKAAPSLFDAAGEPERVRRDGVSDFIHKQAQGRYGERVSKEDIFYYVYGFLHSPEYRQRFSADLKKMLPRLPLVESPKDFWAFSQAGRQLADLHLQYDDFSKAPSAEAIGVVVVGIGGQGLGGREQGLGIGEQGAESDISPVPNPQSQTLSPQSQTPSPQSLYRVEKMRFPSKMDKSRILYNSYITIENIPAAAYEYVVNGKSAIEWVMERYAITTHKDSGIRNDPNDWAAECGNPRYILDVLLSVIRLSVETVEVVRGLPGLNL